MKTFCIVINDVLSININIQNTTIFELVILTGFYTSSTVFINFRTYYVYDWMQQWNKKR